MMKFNLNGQSFEFSRSAPLTEIIAQNCSHPSQVIAEVNGQIIKNEQWPATLIKEGDTVELLKFVGGGNV